MNMSNTFEYPYNFNFDELYYLCDKCPLLKDRIALVYLPAYVNHSVSTRPVTAFNPSDETTYVKHIKAIQAIGLNVAILFQDFDTRMNDDIIQYYLDLNISHFIVARDDTAESIRRLHKDAYIIASVLRQLTPEQIYTHDYPDIYDLIVLPFYFNNNLEAVKKLPTDMEYSLFANSLCIATGDELSYCVEHWRGNYEGCCHRTLCDNKGQIPLTDLSKFKPYVKFFKLQGRDMFLQQRLHDVLPWVWWDLTGVANEFDLDEYMVWAATHTGETMFDVVLN